MSTVVTELFQNRIMRYRNLAQLELGLTILNIPSVAYLFYQLTNWLIQTHLPVETRTAIGFPIACALAVPILGGILATIINSEKKEYFINQFKLHQSSGGL